MIEDTDTCPGSLSDGHTSPPFGPNEKEARRDACYRNNLVREESDTVAFGEADWSSSKHLWQLPYLSVPSFDTSITALASSFSFGADEDEPSG